MPDIFSDFKMTLPVAQHEQITAFLRQQVQSGALAAGARLPTTQELARRWGVTVTVIQAALAPLVREGLLLRRPRVGTVVRERSPMLSRVGLYRISDPTCEGADHFSRRLAAVTAAQLATRGIATELFTDLRPEDQRTAPWDHLMQAIRTGRIDAVIGCESEARVHPWLAHLSVPSVIYGAPGFANGLGHDTGQFGRDGIACLAARGCRSAGLVSVYPLDKTELDGSLSSSNDLYHGFMDAAASAGITTNPAWICTPPHDTFLPETRAERFGYDGIRAMWSGPQRPEGLVVFTDLAARGVIMGLLSCLSDDQPKPHLALHRNSELGLFCPLPADFLDVSLTDLAATLIDRLERQRQGETLTWMVMPFMKHAAPLEVPAV